MIISDIDFKMEQVKSSPFFDRYFLEKIHEGSEKERSEFQLYGYGMTFESCVKHIISYRLAIKYKELTTAQYIQVFKKEVKLFFDNCKTDENIIN